MNQRPQELHLEEQDRDGGEQSKNRKQAHVPSLGVRLQESLSRPSGNHQDEARSNCAVSQTRPRATRDRLSP
jgi:hypothetical protein